MKMIVNGIVAEYSDEGKGPALLLLHGWKDSLQTFDPLMPVLAEAHRVIRVDLPGFGGSEMPAAAWHLDDFVRFVKDFTEKLDVSVDVLVGHSLGGRIAIKGIALKVLDARKVVLISSAGIAKRRTFRNVLLGVLAKAGKIATAVPPLSFWKQRIRRKLYEAIGSDYFGAGALRGTFMNIVREDLSSVAPKISVPTLLIWGSDDKTTPLTDGMRLHGLVRGSILKVIPGAGHFVHRERPEEVSELILKFIS